MDFAKKIAKAGSDTFQAGQAQLAGLQYGISGAAQAPASTIEDEATRQQQGFHEVEATLPKEITQKGTPLFDRVMAFAFGDKNPIAQEADVRTNIVWLFDNTAYRLEGNERAHWEAEFVVAYFVKDSGRDLSAAVSNIADKIGIDDGHLGDKESARKTIEKRLMPFALSIQPARFINIVLPSEEVRQLGPGDSNGISSQTVGELGVRKPGETIRTLPLRDELAPQGAMSTYFAEPEGWTVVSDIDDSIKVTMTSSPIGMLQSTFYDSPTPVTGMPELYAQIQELLQPSWFYLSASPYTLYTFLRPFLREHYPHGTLILREASWQDLNGLLQSLTIGTEAYKSSRIDKIHRWFPLRKVLCVGDSTQSDPEAYGDICRKYPGWIKAIFIRKVTGVKGINVTTKNSPERFEKAFRDIPKSTWKIFEDPNDLKQAVRSLTTI